MIKSTTNPEKGQSSVWSAIKSALPRNDLPGAQQSTPFNVNRYILLIVYCIQTFLTGCVYFGWAALASVLIKKGAFLHLCEDIDLDNPKPSHFSGDPQCIYQDVAVQKLFTIVFAVHCTTSAFAGYLLDTIGPKCTAVFGQILNIIAWSCLASITPQTSILVYAGIIFIGLAADTAFLPTLNITRLFPGSTGLIISVLGSAASGSFAIPAILEAMFNNQSINNEYILWYFVVWGPGLCLVIDLFFMPLHSFKTNEELLLNIQQAGNIELSDKAISDKGISDIGVDIIAKTDSFEPLHDTPITKSGCTPNSSDHSNDSTLPYKVSTNDKSLVKGEPVVYTFKSFLKECFSVRYALICAFYVGVSWICSFYQLLHTQLFVPSAVELLKTITPLSFIPCVLFGKLADSCGILPVVFTLNTFGILSFIFSFFKNAACGYLSVICFTFYVAFYASQVFVYIEAVFSPESFGKLIGIIQLIGGLFSLICNPIYDAAVLSSGGFDGIFWIQIGVIGIIILQYIYLCVLLYLWKKDPSPYKLKPTGVM